MRFQKFGNYRGIKLMSHSMNIWENIIEKKIISKTVVTRN